MSAAKTFCWGLLSRRERIGLSWRGWLLLLLVCGSLMAVWIFNIQPFLAQNERVDARVMVMEGWVQEYTAQQVANEFISHSYRQIYTTGGPIPGAVGPVGEARSLAGVGADLLEKAGVPARCIQIVPARVVGRDRTYNSALALRDWFHAHGVNVRKLNLYTEDAHARRSRMLFQEAFGSEVTVGVVSIPDPDYDPAHWWRYSEGVRTVLGETIAYVYARFFFHPDRGMPST